MSLQFILGNSGSGKSDRTYQAIVEEAGRYPDRNYLVLVPEQFTMQTQRKLVELAPNHAIMNIDVLSFQRLAYRIFDELGMNNQNVLEETGKNLILRKLAEDHKDQLTVLKQNMGRMGYIGEVKSFISELVQYDISPDQLETYSRRPDISATFASKLQDIVVIYRSFRNYLGENYITAEEILNVLIAAADKSEILRDSVMVFDEYTGFTPIQNKLIRKLLPICSRIQVILTIDEKVRPETCTKEHDLFYLTGKTMASLTKMANELQVPVEVPIVMGKSEKMRFDHSEDLAFLEKNLFRSWHQVSRNPVKDIKMASLRNPKEELYLAARTIRQLVQEEGYRYREIAIVTGAVDNYSSYAEETCGKYQIPFFLDQTTKLVFHPFIECIRAILEVIADDFSYEAMFRFLRSGFSGLEEDRIDHMDTYLLMTGIRGHKAWESRWLKQPGGIDTAELEALEEGRKYLFGLFAPLWDAFHEKTATVAKQIVVFYQLLSNLHAEEMLWQKEKEYLEAGEQVKSKEYGQIYRVVMELLEKFYHLLGSEHMRADEFAEILDAGLSEAKVASIPPGFDCVTIGDIERTRLNGVKVLFFLGVNDGIIPKSKNNGGIISEFERQMMQEAEIELAPGAREQAFIQRFYLYRNLTKPSRRLYVSFSRADAEGKALRPSYLADTLRNLFPALEIKEYDRILEEMNLSTPDAALDYLLNGEQDDAWYALALYFMTHRKEETEKLLKARYQTCAVDPISRIVAEAVYGHNLEGSVTRLEQYASCAYSHFLRYGLLLRERDSAGFESVDIGNIYHNALLRYSLHVESSQYDWFRIPDPVRVEYSRQAMEEAIQEDPKLSLFATAENFHQTKRMEAIFEQTVWALTQQVRAGRFVPSAFEVSFSELNDSNHLRMELDRDHAMLLRGRIDRLDLLHDEDRKCYIKIIDYKSGSETFDLVRVYQGLSLQLVAYMNYAQEITQRKYPEEDVQPAALFYYNIDDPAIEEPLDEQLSEEELQHLILEALRPGGLVNREETIFRAMDEDFTSKSRVIPVTLKKDGTISERGSRVASTGEFSIIQKYVVNRMKADGKKIYEGDISINPYDSAKKKSCTYCPYSSICGVYSRLPGIRTRTIPKMEAKDAIDKMETYNAMVEE